MTAFYVASKAKHGPLWLEWRRKGVTITSNWIDIWDSGKIDDAAGHWRQIRTDIEACDTLVLYSLPGEIQKGALVEMGIAMGLNKTVLYVAPEDVVTALRADNVHKRESLEEIFTPCTLP